MKTQIVIYPPNRPLERIIKPSQTPVLFENLFFIDVNNDGEIILGSSNVAGTYWEASLIHYKNISDAMDNVYLGYFLSNSTTSDAKILKNTGTVSGNSIKDPGFPNSARVKTLKDVAIIYK